MAESAFSGVKIRDATFTGAMEDWHRIVIGSYAFMGAIHCTDGTVYRVTGG